MELVTHSQATAGTRIRLPLPRPDQMLCVRDLGDGRSMILPTKEKLEWEVAERPYRSVIVDTAGYVLSTGFAKFGNHGEPCFADADRALDRAIADGSAVLVAEKLDGIQAVRSVIDGVVIFRTRASADGSVFAEHMRAVAAERYRMAENGEVQRLAARHDCTRRCGPRLRRASPNSAGRFETGGVARASSSAPAST